MAEEITLDTFFAGQTIPLCNLAAQLGTTRTERADSVWAGADYGGSIEGLLGRRANATALAVEIERSLSVVELTATVAVGDAGINMPELGATFDIERGVLTDA